MNGKWGGLMIFKYNTECKVKEQKNHLFLKIRDIVKMGSKKVLLARWQRVKIFSNSREQKKS